MSEMTEKESEERFCESLRMVEDRCAEMARVTADPTWDNIGRSIAGLRHKGEAIMVSRSLSRADLDESLNNVKDYLIRTTH